MTNQFSEFEGRGALLADQRYQQVLNLFRKGMSGWRMLPDLEWSGTDQKLARLFGGHNHKSVIFHNGQQYEYRTGTPKSFCAGRDGGLFLENNFPLTTASSIATKTCEFEAYEKLWP